MGIAADIAQADSYTIHKREFDRIRVQYKLDTPEKAEQIADLLSNTKSTATSGAVSASEFAKMFDMTPEDAMIFLDWIKVGVKVREDGAKNTSLTSVT